MSLQQLSPFGLQSPQRQCRTCHHKQPSPVSGIICGLSGLVRPLTGTCGMWALGKGVQ